MDAFAWIFVFIQSFSDLSFDNLKHLKVFDKIHLVEEDDDRAHSDLSAQKDVFLCLRHRAIHCTDDQDAAVHLGCPCDHVLNVVDVTRTVDVSIVSQVGLVLYGCSIDGNASFLLLLGLVDIVVGHVLCLLVFGQHFGDCAGEGGLAVIDVSDRAHVDVGFRSIIFRKGP